VTIDFFGL